MMYRKLQPSGDHILIQFTQTPRLEPSSPRAASKPSIAKVIAVGPGRAGADGNVIPLGLKVGEKVFVDHTRGVRIRLNRQSYAVIRKRDLIAAAG